MLHISGSIDALTREGSDEAVAGRTIVCSPAVGLVSKLPAVGDVIVPGRALAHLNVLGNVRTLRAPATLSGRVVEVFEGNLVNSCEYGQQLLVVAPLTATDADPLAPGVAARDAVPADLPDGSVAVRATTIGTFYRRPSPDAEPYVREGELITSGHAIGLIEVMKVFNRVRWQGAGAAKVVRLVAEDSREVRAGDVLIYVVPT